jgi:WD40 repeat protein
MSYLFITPILSPHSGVNVRNDNVVVSCRFRSYHCLPFDYIGISALLTYLIDLPGHKDEVYAVDWSPDGQKVGSGGRDKAVRVWRN